MNAVVNIKQLKLKSVFPAEWEKKTENLSHVSDGGNSTNSNLNNMSTRTRSNSAIEREKAEQGGSKFSTNYRKKCEYLQKEISFLKKRLSVLILQKDEIQQKHQKDLEEVYLFSPKQSPNQTLNINGNANANQNPVVKTPNSHSNSNDFNLAVNSNEFSQEKQLLLLQQPPEMPDPFLNEDLEVAWDLTNALYDTLWEIFEFSVFSAQKVAEKIRESAKNWDIQSNNEDEQLSSNGEENLELEELRQAMQKVQEKYPPISEYGVKNMLIFQNVSKKGPLLCETIEDFVGEV